MVHTMICRPLAEQAPARSQASAREICGGQSGTLRYLGFFPLGITTLMFHKRSGIYHWRYRTLATDILALKMEPIYHPETSETNYPLKLGNSPGDQKPQNTSTLKIYLYTKFNILNFHWYISSRGQAANKMWISSSCHVALFHYTKRILNKIFMFVANLLQQAIPGLHMTWPSVVLKL